MPGAVDDSSTYQLGSVAVARPSRIRDKIPFNAKYRTSLFPTEMCRVMGIYNRSDVDADRQYPGKESNWTEKKRLLHKPSNYIACMLVSERHHRRSTNRGTLCSTLVCLLDVAF
jgi:hypothetical protein